MPTSGTQLAKPREGEREERDDIGVDKSRPVGLFPASRATALNASAQPKTTARHFLESFSAKNRNDLVVCD